MAGSGEGCTAPQQSPCFAPQATGTHCTYSASQRCHRRASYQHSQKGKLKPARPVTPQARSQTPFALPTPSIISPGGREDNAGEGRVSGRVGGCAGTQRLLTCKGAIDCLAPATPQGPHNLADTALALRPGPLPNCPPELGMQPHPSIPIQDAGAATAGTTQPTTRINGGAHMSPSYRPRVGSDSTTSSDALNSGPEPQRTCFHPAPPLLRSHCLQAQARCHRPHQGHPDFLSQDNLKVLGTHIPQRQVLHPMNPVLPWAPPGARPMCLSAPIPQEAQGAGTRPVSSLRPQPNYTAAKMEVTGVGGRACL